MSDRTDISRIVSFDFSFQLENEHHIVASLDNIELYFYETEEPPTEEEVKELLDKLTKWADEQVYRMWWSWQNECNGKQGGTNVFVRNKPTVVDLGVRYETS